MDLKEIKKVQKDVVKASLKDLIKILERFDQYDEFYSYSSRIRSILRDLKKDMISPYYANKSAIYLRSCLLEDLINFYKMKKATPEYFHAAHPNEVVKRQNCPNCNGEGINPLHGDDCETCAGTGVIEELIEVKYLVKKSEK